MYYKVIFLENEEFYNDMISSDFFKNCSLTYDGAKLYKKNKSFKNYDLVVYTIYSSPYYNFLIYHASLQGVNTLLLMDGICEFSNFTKNSNIKRLNIDNYHPIIANSIAVVGTEAKNYFSMYGINSVIYLPPRVCTMNYHVKLDNNNTFLITTANTAYYDEDEFKLLVSLLKATIKNLIEGNFNFYFRIYDQRIINDLNISDDINLITGSFESVLEKVDYVITTPSSIMLTAMYANKPVAMLLYRDVPNFIQSGWILFEGCNFINLFESMKEKDLKRMSFQASQVKYNLQREESVDKCFAIEPIYDYKHIHSFIDQNLFNMLNSKFNFNFESTFRKFYIHSRKYFLLKKIFNYIKKLR
ncbi:hypothetical protein A6E12_09290 [Aliivibrio fischeri]|uniref:hypothetical protein n=1 Tax=Aliivibrio fischeri TaxID=668 RepID=UPI00080DC4F9|nr:hypothetical protein [Aliivibrio fischeri]OCH28674.1 hypothetical protein A6E12_09290 [Aliivibrio fischeri]